MREAKSVCQNNRKKQKKQNQHLGRESVDERPLAHSNLPLAPGEHTSGLRYIWTSFYFFFISSFKFLFFSPIDWETVVFSFHIQGKKHCSFGHWPNPPPCAPFWQLCNLIHFFGDKCFLIKLNRVAEVAREHGWHPPKSLDSDENFKPEHTLFCRELRFVAIYALFLEIFGHKKCLFG